MKISKIFYILLLVLVILTSSIIKPSNTFSVAPEVWRTTEPLLFPLASHTSITANSKVYIILTM